MPCKRGYQNVSSWLGLHPSGIPQSLKTAAVACVDEVCLAGKGAVARSGTEVRYANSVLQSGFMKYTSAETDNRGINDSVSFDATHAG